MTQPLQFDCPFCAATIEVASSSNGAEAARINCGQCQREVEIPRDPVEKAVTPDSDGHAEKRFVENKKASRLPTNQGSFGIRCTVCDSSTLVGLHQVGKDVKCSDCFSTIKVREPTDKQQQQIEKQIRLWEKNKSTARDNASAGEELTLAPLRQDEPPEEKLSEETGGEDNFADVLIDEEDGDLGEDLLAGGLPLSVDKQANSNQSGLNPYRSKSAQQAQRRAGGKGFKLKQKKSEDVASQFPELRFDSFFGAAVDLVTEPTVAVRGIIAAALMATGNVISHAALATYSAIDKPTMVDTATMGFWRLGVGWLPYAIGTILLWYFCGVVFRETAGGKKKIKSWKLGPTTEWTSTLLLTAVSFAVAGAPAMMLMSIYVTAPVRFLLALPFLTAVWHTQSPFGIVSADVAMHFRENLTQWTTVFLVVLSLASIAFVAGILLHVPVPWLNILTSAIGAMSLSLVTLAFAAVAGWHSKMVVEQLN